MRIRDVGCVKVWQRDDESAFCFHPDDYEPIMAAWKAGSAFFTGSDLFGQPITIKLSTVSVISRATPESVAEYEREKAEDDADRLINGDSSDG